MKEESQLNHFKLPTSVLIARVIKFENINIFKRRSEKQIFPGKLRVKK